MSNHMRSVLTAQELVSFGVTNMFHVVHGVCIASRWVPGELFVAMVGVLLEEAWSLGKNAHLWLQVCGE